MHNAVLVRRGESGCHLPRELDRLLDRKGASLQSIGEGLPFEVLHDEVVDPLVGADVMKCTDVRVVKLRYRFRLALETRSPRGVPRELRRQHLERHAPVETGVLRFVDLAHAPGAEGRENLVGSELQTWLDTHLSNAARAFSSSGKFRTTRSSVRRPSGLWIMRNLCPSGETS